MPKTIQPRRVKPLKIAGVALVLVLLFLVTARRRPPPDTRPVFELHGETMGTTYTVQLADAGLSAPRVDGVGPAVEACLAEVNRQMSPYDPASEISRFNAAPAGDAVPVSAPFAAVTRFALDLAARSGGRFDPTVLPLVRLWGFGGGTPRTEPPAPEAVRAALADVGYRHVTADAAGTLAKDRAGVRLDLSAVAKGYGVDAVRAVLEAQGLTNFFVEVGGEVYAAGHNAYDAPWRIGVDRPAPGSLPGDRLQATLHLSGRAVATSGDYRQFFTAPDGQLYTHIIDPLTGQSVRRPPSGVSVVAFDCMTADGLATTLFVMGPDAGLPWLREQYPSAEALFLVLRPDGTVEERATPGFRAVAGYPPHAPPPAAD